MNEYGAAETMTDVALVMSRTLDAAYAAYKAVAYSDTYDIAWSQADSYKSVNLILDAAIKGYCKAVGVKTRVSRIREIMLDSGENAYYAIGYLNGA